MTNAIEQFWQAYLTGLPLNAPERDQPFVAEAFGDNPALADELAALIVAGVKTATCSCLWEWEAEGQPLPAPGLKTIVLDGRDQPVALIETTTIEIRPFNEGEGDRSLGPVGGSKPTVCSSDFSRLTSPKTTKVVTTNCRTFLRRDVLASWREGHWRYFSRALPRIGREPTETMPLVCERFRLLYPRTGAA